MPTRSALRSGAPFSLLLLILGAAGCGDDAAAPAPPANLTVTQSASSFDEIQVLWTPPPGGISGYEAEGRMGDGPWESLGPIPPDVIGGTLSVDPGVPELTRFSFRLRSVRDGKTSAWIQVEFLRGLRWPVSAGSDHAREGIRLTWINASLAATGVRISRLFDDGWRAVAELPATATTWVDSAQLVAGVAVGYRISATAGEVESLPAERWDAYPPVPVFDLTATPEAGGVHLRWVNPPVASGAIEIHRAEGLVAAYFSNLDPVVLPSVATEYLDAVPGGTWTWHVVTVYPDVPAAPWAQVRAASNPPGPLGLQASLVSLPDASAMASDGAAVLGFAIGGAYYPPATGEMRLAFQGTGAPPGLDLGTAHGFAGAQLAFDPSGRPHAVLLRPADGDALVRLVHVAYDGATWTEEEIARRPLDDPTTVRFALDAAGALHAAWSTSTGAVRAEYARPEGGGYVIEDLTAALPDGARVAALDVDALGVACVAVNSSTGSLLARREATWAVETIPGAGGVMDVRRSPAGLDVVETECVGPVTERTGELVVVERTAAGWGPAQLVRALAQCLPVESLRIARSPVGSRAVLWGSVVGRLELDLRADDAWTHLDTWPQVHPTSVAWFDGAGKLRLVARSDGYPEAGGTAPYIQYVEP